MPDFYSRLRDYYIKIAKVLKGEADAAAIFANSTDKGISREKTYVRFLQLHVPKKCTVSLGGFATGLLVRDTVKCFATT